MGLEEQRKELAEMMKEAKEKNRELKRGYEPIEFYIGSWFKYDNRIFVLKGLKGNQPEFLEYKQKGENMAVDNNGKWVGNLNKIELSDLELDYFKVAKEIEMIVKFTLPDFKSIKEFLEKIDLDNMSLLEAVIINVLTGKTFVKNSWSDEAKSRLQTFIYDRKLITQDGNEVSTKSSSIKIDSPERYSIYQGCFKSLIDSDNEKIKRLKELETEIAPFYNKMKEYEQLKRDLNL